MDFVANSEAQVKEMMQTIGISSIEELFASIPEILKRPKLSYDDGLSEYEGMQLMQSLAKKNRYSEYDNYLGAGAYEHHIPAIVGAICSKSEFLSSYTPYQAEASQGMLQIIFEYQSAICALTGMDVANASLYDGASACAEAVLMAMRLQKERGKVLIAASLNPRYRCVVDQYLKSHAIEVETIPYTAGGLLDRSALIKALKQPVLGLLLQSPNFFGVIEEVEEINAELKQKNSLLLLASNPLSYGLYRSAGDLGADIAVGDSQPLGLPLSFGGPFVGYLACRQDLVRQMPGRLVGETVDTAGRRGFVLTLQAREQHIRREKATSNICTNQALAALASLIAIMWYGKKGIRALALTNAQRAHYLKERLQAIPGTHLLSTGAIFNEFAISFGRPIQAVQAHFRNNHIEPGLDLGRMYKELQDYLLVAVTEVKTKAQLDRYIAIAKTV